VSLELSQDIKNIILNMSSRAKADISKSAAKLKSHFAFRKAE
jgi:post-segregation antitoxin (ccd killing protein)